MKRFRFALEPLRRWRELQLETEEAELIRLRAVCEGMRRGIERLEGEMAAEREQVKRDGVDGGTLAAADEWAQWAGLQRARLLQKEQDATRRAEEQSRKVSSARVGLETLEQLKTKQKAECRKAADAELERMVAELVVSRWRER